MTVCAPPCPHFFSLLCLSFFPPPLPTERSVNVGEYIPRSFFSATFLPPFSLHRCVLASRHGIQKTSSLTSLWPCVCRGASPFSFQGNLFHPFFPPFGLPFPFLLYRCARGEMKDMEAEASRSLSLLSSSPRASNLSAPSLPHRMTSFSFFFLVRRVDRTFRPIQGRDLPCLFSPPFSERHGDQTVDFSPRHGRSSAQVPPPLLHFLFSLPLIGRR